MLSELDLEGNSLSVQGVCLFPFLSFFCNFSYPCLFEGLTDFAPVLADCQTLATVCLKENGIDYMEQGEEAITQGIYILFVFAQFYKAPCILL